MKIRNLLVLVVVMFLAGCVTAGSGNRRVAAEAKSFFLVILEPGEAKEVALVCADVSESGVANIATGLREKIEAALAEKGFKVSDSAKIKISVNVLGFGGEKEAMGPGGALLGAAVGVPTGILASKHNRGKGALLGAGIGAGLGLLAQHLLRETEVFLRVGVGVTDATGSGQTTIIAKTSDFNTEPVEAVPDLTAEVAKRVASMFRTKIGG